jgi:DHA1 family bicyclomycin/chloramphenicol resistance-like MFS transporter
MLLPFLLILSLIAKFIEIDISVPSFPDMVHYFNVSEGTIQLTIAYNFLGSVNKILP